MNLFLINYQNGNGNVNKQNLKGMEEKIKHLESVISELKKVFFALQTNTDINKNWPQLSNSQMN